VGVHGADQHGDAPGDVADRGLDEFAPLVVAQGQKLAGGAEDDQAGHADAKLPVEEGFPAR